MNLIGDCRFTKIATRFGYLRSRGFPAQKFHKTTKKTPIPCTSGRRESRSAPLLETPSFKPTRNPGNFHQQK
ncbi:hypothetical protein ACM44_13700 [Chryseobacterium koreense CCUG 49689]|uniref:Uncharacterized protein n=1 Tax=Chryseobacterium koreense CCUG 49689 TaxID=1304281 RepID=A0A0J7IV72_9FLAO|nr:hypothetical protein ACM44_13700 [Chryseobacterium koreense CCUG 49689]